MVKTLALALNLPLRQSRKFRSSLFKGLQVSKGQSPLLVLFADSHSFSRLIKRSCFGCRHWATQNVVQKEKVAVSEMISEGRSSTMFRLFIKSLSINTHERREKLHPKGIFFQNPAQKSFSKKYFRISIKSLDKPIRTRYNKGTAGEKQKISLKKLKKVNQPKGSNKTERKYLL